MTPHAHLRSRPPGPVTGHGVAHEERVSLVAALRETT